MLTGYLSLTKSGSSARICPRLSARPHRLEAKDIALSRRKPGFESRWGHSAEPARISGFPASTPNQVVNETSLTQLIWSCVGVRLGSTTLSLDRCLITRASSRRTGILGQFSRFRGHISYGAEMIAANERAKTVVSTTITSSPSTHQGRPLARISSSSRRNSSRSRSASSLRRRSSASCSRHCSACSRSRRSSPTPPMLDHPGSPRRPPEGRPARVTSGSAARRKE